MFCNNCGNKLNGNEDFCPNCGTKKQIINENNKELTLSEKMTKKAKKTNANVKKFFKKNKKVFLPIFICLIVLLGGFLSYKIVSNYIYEKTIHYLYKIDGKKYKIGEKVSYYEKNGYTYKDKYSNDNDIIPADSFIPHLFYKNDEAVMYAALHCKEKDKCKYFDSSVVKINFYNNIGDVVLADFIKIGTTYDEIVSKLGEPDGKFYMNDYEYVWSFYDKGKINNPYYVLEFDNSKKVVKMKIGMWWYDGEYEYTVKK